MRLQSILRTPLHSGRLKNVLMAKLSSLLSFYFPLSDRNICLYRDSTSTPRVSTISQSSVINLRRQNKYFKISVMAHTLITIQAVQWKPPLSLVCTENRVKSYRKNLVVVSDNNNNNPTCPLDGPGHDMNFSRSCRLRTG